MKWIHNDKVSLGWAIFIELVAHGFFAFQAFLLGGFIGEIALTQMFGKYWGNVVGSWALALFIFGAAFQAYVLGEYMREHVKSYEAMGHDGSYMRSWKHIRWIVGGLELSSLAFRFIVVIVQGDLLQAVIVGIFGILLLYYAYAQAKVIHASVNRDVSYDVAKAQDKMGRDVVKDALDMSDEMTAEEKRKFINGDTSGLDTAISRRRSRETRKIDQETAEYERSQRSRETAGQLLSYPEERQPFTKAQLNQDGNLSRNQNGNGRHN